jgi:hypothetical protein
MAGVARPGRTYAAAAQLGEAGINALLAPGGLIYDLKGILPLSASHARI